jgi:hypothetical protein
MPKGHAKSMILHSIEHSIETEEALTRRKTIDPATEKLLYSTGNFCRQAGMGF